MDVVVVGAGVTGLAAARRVLNSAPGANVTVLESAAATGGLVRTSGFAGLDIDEGADAFLVRVPWARDLAVELGMATELVAPVAAAHASIWHDGLHRIPGDLVLGVPASIASLAAGNLFSIRGRLRAAIEPLLPRTEDHRDCIGELIRARFGREVHERLVDPLVGSIYAADTDHFSLEAVPQIARLATSRSMLLAAQRARADAASSTASSGVAGGQVFAAPRGGMATLTRALADAVATMGGTIRTSTEVVEVVRDDRGANNTRRDEGEYVVSTSTGEFRADAVILAAPARAAAGLVRSLSPDAHRALSLWTHASVVMITLAVSDDQWPARLDGSGYLVPKPDQRWVTAASFGSNTWAHWRPADGSRILRVSLGRDGLDVLDHDDDTLVNLALADLKHHLGVDLAPRHLRVTRWPRSFPQYRPGHFVRLAAIESALRSAAPGVVLAGASYRGIGIPACIQQADEAAARTVAHLAR